MVVHKNGYFFINDGQINISIQFLIGIFQVLAMMWKISRWSLTTLIYLAVSELISTYSFTPQPKQSNTSTNTSTKNLIKPPLLCIFETIKLLNICTDATLDPRKLFRDFLNFQLTKSFLQCKRWQCICQENKLCTLIPSWLKPKFKSR